jgi:hypothetical protein
VGAGGNGVIAALYVQPDGCYANLPGVDAWDEARDARNYAGPWPVVAHPPCQRWGRFWFGSPLVVARTGERLKLGDDGGCFAAALAAVRRWGGVIEHPAGSLAWAHFGLPRPYASDWATNLGDGGWSCQVEQGHYGHYSRKPTWLYVHGIKCADLPELVWGPSETRLDPETVARIGEKKARRRGLAFKGGGGDDRERSATPLPFRDLLLSIAARARPSSATIPTSPGASSDCPPPIPATRAGCNK